MAKSSGKIRGITIELTADTVGIMDGLKDINKELSATDKALKDTNKLLKFDDNNTELVAQQQQYLSQAIEQTQEKLRKEKELLAQLQNADNASETTEQQNALKREIEATTQKLNGYKSQLDDTEANLKRVKEATADEARANDEAVQTLRRLNEKYKEVEEETEQATQKTITFGDIVKANLTSEAIIRGVEKLCDGIAKISKSAIETGSAFEASMSQVAATMGITTAEIANGSEKFTLLSDAAKKSGAETMYSASQAGEALNYLALAGYDAEKAAATLPKVLTLAAAGGMDLAYASDLVTDSMSAMGMETDELDNYIDEMTKTAQKANTSVAQLGEATLECAGTVTLTGQELETMNAELGVLANNGIKGAEGGTHLRNILLSLSAPTDKAAASLKSLRVETTDSEGNLRDLNDIMTDLNASLEGMGSADKAAIIKNIFNKTDIAAVNALMKGTSGEFQNLKNEITNCSGAADEMAKTMTDNLKGKLTILSSALEALGISFYEVFDDNAKKSVDSATDAVGQLNDAVKYGDLGVSLANLSEEFEVLTEDVINFAMDSLPKAINGLTRLLDNIDTITSLLKGLGAGYLAYEIATVAATIATEGFTAALSLNPIGLAVGAVAGLTAGLAALYKESTKLSPEIENLSRNASHLADNANGVSKSADDLISGFSGQAKIAGRLKEELNNLIDPTTGVITNQTKAAGIIAELNALIPDLNLAINEQGEVVSGAKDNWQAYIDTMLEQAQLEAINEKLIEVEQTKLDVESELLELEEKMGEAALEKVEAYRTYNELADSTNRLTEEQNTLMGESWQKLKDLTDEDYALIESYIKNQEALKGLGTQEDNLLAKMEEARDRTNEAAEASGEYSDALNTSVESANTLSGMLNELVDDYAETKEKAVESLEGQREAFEEMNTSTGESVDEIAEHLQKQAENMKNYAELIGEAQEIMEKEPESSGLLNYYISAGPEAAGELENLVEAFNEGGEAAEAFKEACEAFAETETLIDGLADLNIAIETGSTEAIESALEQLNVSLPEMEEAFRVSWGQQETDADTHKETMTQTATQTVTDMATAVTTNEPKITTAITTLADNAVKKLREAWRYDEGTQRFMAFYDAGMQVDESLAAGITDGSGKVAEAIQTMCEAAVDAVDISGLASRIDAALGAAFG